MKKCSSLNKGLYVPQQEADACGIGIIAQIENIPTHSIVSDGLTLLERMEHRGACGYEENTGDGAGILCQIPDELFRFYALRSGIKLPSPGRYAVAVCFLPKNNDQKERCLSYFKKEIGNEGFSLLFIREVQVNNTIIGDSAKSTEPDMVQVFVDTGYQLPRQAVEARLFYLRNKISRQISRKYPKSGETFYIASFSTQTIVYKGQLKATQLRNYFDDLSNPSFKSAVAMVHSRFSTNTTPQWKLAQPFRFIAHNGEINTIQGNMNWWHAREKNTQSIIFNKKEHEQLIPVCDQQLSDSANFDASLEYLVHNGKSIPHALMMMIPEAWHQAGTDYPDYRKEFYTYHENIMEPWDGPAAICFTDGVLAGACLDRNGLRPSKYCLTKDKRLIIASEAGILAIDQDQIVYKKNLSPGKMLIANLQEKRIIGDEELKEAICKHFPYKNWLAASVVSLQDLTPLPEIKKPQSDFFVRKVASGLSREDEEKMLEEMINNGKEAVGSMGYDIPLAILSKHNQHICNYFRQNFAQVTNPPIDPIREKMYMSLECFLGVKGCPNKGNSLHHKLIRLESPVLSHVAFHKILNASEHSISHSFIDATFEASPYSLKQAMIACGEQAEAAIKKGSTFLIVDNTRISKERAAIPALLATAYIHQYLTEKGLRKDVSIVVCGSDIFEAHHYACLIGYGADAVYAQQVYEWIEAKKVNLQEKEKAAKNYAKAVNEGLLKIMSKLGISTVLSYKGAKTFEALGIHEEVIAFCFKGTVSRIGGLKLEGIAKEQLNNHEIAFSKRRIDLPDSGKFQWKKEGEYHLFNPLTIHLLQHASTTNDYKLFRRYSLEMDRQEKNNCTIRSLFELRKGKSIPLEEVEPVESILKRFATGAMSLGSISEEAHTTLALAMNRIGGKSNSGEGGEDEARYIPNPDGSSSCSAIKQVASARFGVTINYLNHATELQIKMAQGAKPGEGGQLPGHKVNGIIARIRHSTPGVELISPPPHHDIYSIEDLAQLIFDLKNANPAARISVKLVSRSGVGIIASGVAKGKADHILISGHDGGTGAAPLSSILYAGLPWEMGIAETHQVLVKNGLRERVTLQTDGQIRTGKDIVIATLLGAEEWGIATAALVVSGCILMRKCHLNTCPVGIATQNEELRKKYKGRVEDLVNYFTFLATETRELMASLGFRTIQEMVGKTDRIQLVNLERSWKYEHLDLSKILYQAEGNYPTKPYQAVEQKHGLEEVLDNKLIQFSMPAIEKGERLSGVFSVNTGNRAIGTKLSGYIAKKHGSAGLAPGSIQLRFKGTAGQSFGAFGIKGLELLVEGEANDFFGKGLSGATLAAKPVHGSSFAANNNLIVGNVALFGATSGKAFICGMAGERFAVRNSGALAVVEGVGDNACEYMTGGTVLLLGMAGKNFAAGMSGGIVYVYDKEEVYPEYLDGGNVCCKNIQFDEEVVIKALLKEHQSYTDSRLAVTLLENWEQEKALFKKVVNSKYEKLMQEQAATESTLTI